MCPDGQWPWRRQAMPMFARGLVLDSQPCPLMTANRSDRGAVHTCPGYLVPSLSLAERWSARLTRKILKALWP